MPPTQRWSHQGCGDQTPFLLSERGSHEEVTLAIVTPLSQTPCTSLCRHIPIDHTKKTGPETPAICPITKGHQILVGLPFRSQVCLQIRNIFLFQFTRKRKVIFVPKIYHGRTSENPHKPKRGPQNGKHPLVLFPQCGSRTASRNPRKADPLETCGIRTNTPLFLDFPSFF